MGFYFCFLGWEVKTSPHKLKSDQKLWSFEIIPFFLAYCVSLGRERVAKKKCFSQSFQTYVKKILWANISSIYIMFTLIRSLFQKSCVERKAVYIYFIPLMSLTDLKENNGIGIVFQIDWTKYIFYKWSDLLLMNPNMNYMMIQKCFSRIFSRKVRTLFVFFTVSLICNFA